MPNIKLEDSDSSLQASLPVASNASTYELNYQPEPSSTLPYHGRHQKGNYRSLDIPSMQTRPSFRDGTGVPTASPPNLTTHHSSTSLKRASHNAEDSSYGETVHDFRTEVLELPKPSINQDHGLLSFSRVPGRHTILDSTGQIQQFDLAAQIHGMFFPPEMSNAGDGLLVQPELTCYRRNLFQISGTVTTPRSSLSLMTERGERFLIMSLEVSVSASESVDGQPVKLIVIPWKTPPPNSPEVSQDLEYEPALIPLVPFDEGNVEASNEFFVYPFAYRRLQFRIATANNGRRRELQQHFRLRLNLVAQLSNGVRTNICETTTAPIVVRGRSPRNFQARKEIPLAGSSSSRGGLPDLHVTTNIGPGGTLVSAPTGNPEGPKPQLPRPPLVFDSNQHLPTSTILLRTPTYPSHLGTQHSEHSTGSSPLNYPPTSIGLEYLQANHSRPDLLHTHLPTTTVSGSQSSARQYTFQPSPVSPLAASLRLTDSNTRPAKSPRHAAPPELPSNVLYPEYGARFGPSYSTENEPSSQRDAGYYPTSLPLPTQAWTTAPEITKAAQAPTSNVQQYAFPSEDYMKDETHTQQNYTWNPA